MPKRRTPSPDGFLPLAPGDELESTTHAQQALDSLCVDAQAVSESVQKMHDDARFELGLIDGEPAS